MGTVKWKVNRLLSDELDYELKIRDVDPLEYGKVADKRKKLRYILASVGADPSLGAQFDFSTLNLEEELDVCQQKYGELEARVASLREVMRITHTKVRIVVLRTICVG